MPPNCTRKPPIALSSPKNGFFIRSIWIAFMIKAECDCLLSILIWFTADFSCGDSVQTIGDRAGEAYSKLANCHMKLDSKHEAANAYAEAAHAYKKTSTTEAVSCLTKSIDLFLDLGRLNMGARYYKEIAEMYESDEDLEKAMEFYEKAADLFLSEDVNTSANQCKLKIAEFAAQLEKYPKAIEIYEDIAQQSLNNNLLQYGAKGHLLNAGICHLCKGDAVSISKALDNYQSMIPSFSGSRECQFLMNLAGAIDDGDIANFNNIVQEFDSTTPLNAWKTTLLLRVKEKLQENELEEDDLT